MSAPLDFRSTSEQQTSEPYADERDGSTTAPHSPIILRGVGPHATNLVPTPPNKQPKSSWIWRHGEAVTDLKDDLTISATRSHRTAWSCACHANLRASRSVTSCDATDPTNLATNML